MLLWYPLMLWQNDGRFTQAEVRIVFVEAALCAVIALFQYVVYRISMRQAKKVVIADVGVYAENKRRHIIGRISVNSVDTGRYYHL